jgi:hypothetical protein
MAIGAYISDAIRNIAGNLLCEAFLTPNGLYYDGCFNASARANLSTASITSHLEAHQLHFDASYVVPIALENRPASVSAYLCIKY